MATRKSNHKSKKARKTKKSSMHSSSESGTGSGTKMSVWCVHERAKRMMVNGHKKVITMKNGNKRAMMVGECDKCHKKVSQFVKL
jgi:hypothetical protein